MEIIQSDRFVKQIRKIKDKQTKERIFKQLQKIIERPEIGDFLSYENGTRKVYVSPFRLLYAYKDNKIYFLDFDHRDKIYTKLAENKASVV